MNLENKVNNKIRSLKILSLKVVHALYRDSLNDLPIPRDLKSKLINYGSKGCMVLQGPKMAQMKGILGLKINSSGNIMISNSKDSTTWVRVRNEDGKYITQHVLFVSADFRREVHGLDASYDCNIIVTGSWDSLIKIWKLMPYNKYECVQVLENNVALVFAVVLSKDYKTIISGSTHGIIMVFELDEKGEYKLKQILEDHLGAVFSLVLSKDSKILISGSEDKTITVWKLNDEGSYECIQILAGHENCIYSLVISENCETLISCSKDKSIRVWKLDDFNKYELYQVLGSENSIFSLAMSEDAEILVSGTRDISIWKKDLNGEYQLINILKGHKDAIYSLAVTKDKKTIFSGSEDKTIRVWDMEYFI